MSKGGEDEDKQRERTLEEERRLVTVTSSFLRWRWFVVRGK
jgi:hypothetical protein